MYKKNRLKPIGKEVRAANTKRVRRFRERKAEAAEAAEADRASQEKLFEDMREGGLLFFGETAPLTNCINITEEIESARRFARLLNVRDIQPGENQKAYILEVMKAWCSRECPLLDTKTETLSPRHVDVPDVEQYVWLENSDTPYNPESTGSATDVQETTSEAVTNA